MNKISRKKLKLEAEMWKEVVNDDIDWCNVEKGF